jgi:hypothetical protein
MKRHVKAAIERAALIAARSGLDSAPLDQADQLLWQKFDVTVGRVEFVAEVFAQMCARRRIEQPVMSVYAALRGPSQ